MFNLKIHSKKDKNAFSISKFIQKWKKIAQFFEFFCRVPIFCILKYKIHAKKDKNAKKKPNKISKNIQKNARKKART